jgi:hypothetical protein
MTRLAPFRKHFERFRDSAIDNRSWHTRRTCVPCRVESRATVTSAPANLSGPPPPPEQALPGRAPTVDAQPGDPSVAASQAPAGTPSSATSSAQAGAAVVDNPGAHDQTKNADNTSVSQGQGRKRDDRESFPESD